MALASIALGAASTGCAPRSSSAPPAPEPVGTSKQALSYSALHTFTSSSAGDSHANGNLVVSGTTVFGTTGGGASDPFASVYTIQTNGSGFNQLHVWPRVVPGDSEGTGPLLLSGSTLFGTRLLGGIGTGAIFSLGTNGLGYQDIHTFPASGVPSAPAGSLAISGSTLYGITTGYNGPPATVGVLYQMGVDGSNFTILHYFDNALDATLPVYGVTLVGSVLYGITQGGGANGAGVLYSFDTTASTFNVLHAFGGAATDPGVPTSLPILVNGALYGTTGAASSGGVSALYRVAPNGTSFTVLRTETTAAESHFSGDVQRLSASSTSLYGCDGDFADDGTLFRVSLDGTQGEWVTDPRTGSGLLGCGGIPALGDAALYVTSSGFGGPDDGTLYQLALNAYTVAASVDSTGPNGTITCTPPNGIPAGGSSTCTIQPAAGYVLFGLADNGSFSLPQVKNGTYTISNIQQDHVVVARFGIPNGTACTSGAACGSGNCFDGFCCDQYCGEQCEACDVSGHQGTCTPVAGAPHGSRKACTTDGTACGGQCDGIQAFQCAYPGNVTECRAPTCANGTATLEGVCNGTGACPPVQTVSCAPFTCGATVCNSNCKVDGDCTPGAFCGAAGCQTKQANGAQCSGDDQCQNGHCVDGVCCDGACTGECEACDATGSVGTCVAVTGAPHGVRPACAGDGSVCTGKCDGTEHTRCTFPSASQSCRSASCANGVAVLGATCDGAGACPPAQSQTCAPFTCGATACLGNCTADADCASGDFCSAGVCVPKHGSGTACAASSECASGPCVDGVCCDRACQGQCEACDVKGHEGTCSPAAGAPHGARAACTTDGSVCGGACDGKNAAGCAFPGATVGCRDASCADGVATLAGACQGNGQCAPKQVQSCTPFTCGATACKGNCTLDTECAAGSFCSAGVCTAQLPDSRACGGSDQCTSGHCVDGVCCDSACTDTCAACDVVGHQGACVAVAGAPHGGRAACAGSGACAGKCDGTSTKACVLPGAETSCGAASCAAGVATGASSCDGTGACTLGANSACGVYACAGDACGTSCSADTDCASGHVCSGGACVVGVDAGIDAGVDAGADASTDSGEAGTDDGGQGDATTGGDGGIVFVPTPASCGCSEVGRGGESGAGWAGLGVALVGVIGRRRRRAA